MGYSFSLEEEKEGMVQKIIDLCSFENLSNLEVNKSGQFGGRAHMIKKKKKVHFFGKMRSEIGRIILHPLRSYVSTR